MRSLLSKVAHRMARSPEELDADELTEHSDALGAAHIREIVDRHLADVCGEVRSLTLPPRTTVPALVAELYDGTGTMTLVWLGRREIHGIAPGVRMRVHGRATYRKGVPTIFNPQYELLPRRHAL